MTQTLTPEELMSKTVTAADLKDFYTKEEKKKLRELFENDVSEFAEALCKDVVTTDIPEFHREIYGMLTKEDRIALAAPRGYAKSTIIAKIYPLWLVLTKKRKDICIVSASETLAVDHMRWIKLALESSNLINYFWGNLQSPK